MRERIVAARSAIVLLVGLVLFHGVVFNGFLAWDDDMYLVNNPRMYAGGLTGFLALFSPEAAYAGEFVEFFPLRDVLYWTIVRVFGFDPMPFHTLNLLLNAVAAVVLLKLLERLGLSPLSALVGALIWVAHPTHVESVAWVAALKDPFVSLFYFGAMERWLRADESGTAGPRRVALLLFVCGLLSKAFIITLPVALVMLDVLRGRPLREVPRRIAPFVILDLLGAAHILYVGAQNKQVIAPAGGSGFSALLTGLWVCALYLQKLLVPVGLSVRYEVAPVLSLSDLRPWVGLLCLATLTVVAIRAWPRTRVPAFAFAFYFVTLAPVLGIVPIPILIADRYQYVPSFALALLAGWSLDELERRRPGGRAPLAVAVVVVVAFAALVPGRVRLWGSEVGLWQEALDRPGAENQPIIWLKLGTAYLTAGLHDHAEHCFNTVVSIAPDEPSTAGLAHYRLAEVERRRGNMDGAIAHARRSYRLLQDAPAAARLSAIALAHGRVAEALTAAEDAVKLDDSEAAHHWVLGVAREAASVMGAEEALREAVRRDPAVCARAAEVPDGAALPQAVCGGR